jgi:metalloprotease
MPAIARTRRLLHICCMAKLLPLLLVLLYGYLIYRFSAWQTARELDTRSSPLADRELQGVFDRLGRAAGIDRVKVRLYEIEPVNGLAAPDGRIFLTRGFYDRYRAGAVTAEELASVVAHEMGHVALGHSRRRMIDFSGQNAIRMALAAILNRFLPVIGIWIAGMLTTMLAARLSRQDEYEADAYAAALMVKSGLGTGPQKALFRKLERLVGAHGGTPVWLMSHPRTPDRIAAIEALESRWSRQIPDA